MFAQITQYLPIRSRTTLINLMLALHIGVFLNIAVLWRNASGQAPLATLTVAIALFGINLALFTLLRGAGRIPFKVLASLLVIFSSCASYYMSFFNVVVGYGVIISTLTLDIDLSRESVGLGFLVWVLLTAIPPVYLLWRHDPAPMDSTFHTPRTRRFIAHAMVFLIAVVVSAAALQIYKKLKGREAAAKNEYTASSLGIMAHSYVPTNWISGVALYGMESANALSVDSTSLLVPSRTFNYQASSTMDDTYVVFVIGETTRHDHLGILGYTRDTTPLLSKETNLVALRGQACDTATKLSLRCMFVREHGTENNAQRTLKERNVFYTLRDLGFSSELYSMQSEIWFYNSIRANKYEVREVIAADPANQNKRIDDMLLVDQLQQSVAEHPKGKHLVVLHTKGSHYLYSQRYPADFRIYLPECPGIDSPCGKTELVNSFDNSVRFIDHMLKNVFDQLRDKKALVFFVADHGESISENNHFHATPREIAPPEQFKVPVIVWASDAFLADTKRKQGFEQLRALQKSNSTVRHEEIFDSLLGCLGYASANGGINPKNNWCAPGV